MTRSMAEGCPRRVYGVDFSGAADAGRKIWIAAGAADSGVLRIDECFRAEALPRSGRDIHRCLAALREFVGQDAGSAFGFDFPFALPAALMGQPSWMAFALSFGGRYPTPQAFREACQRAAGGRELKRTTDRESQTPFSPYNLRVYRQTYFGIRDLLAPMAANGRARVFPMQLPLRDRPWILETCPASLLKLHGQYSPYKGMQGLHCAARARILSKFEERRSLSILRPGLRRKILADPGGDALDSVLAALATFAALRDPGFASRPRKRIYLLEGQVYPAGG